MIGHIKNIYNDGELIENSVCKELLHTASDCKKYNVKHYNLDKIYLLLFFPNNVNLSKWRGQFVPILLKHLVIADVRHIFEYFFNAFFVNITTFLKDRIR